MLTGFIVLLVVLASSGGWVYWSWRQKRLQKAAEDRRQDVAEVQRRRQERRRKRAEANLASIRHPRPGTERRPVVLVVDDSETARTAMRTLLEEYDYRVILAENGRSAWRILQDQKPDLVISDIDMPYINGIQLVQLIRQDLELLGVPVILMTSHLMYDVQVGKKSGVDGFLSKPYQPVDVLAQVRFALAE